jgi:hypothetical protein
MRILVEFDGNRPRIGGIKAQRWPAPEKPGSADMTWQKGGLPVKVSDGKNVADGIDVAIVHQGVVDRIKDKFKDVDEAGSRFLKVLSDACTLIVESGRGIPPDVQTSNDRFLPFSSVERAFNDGRVAKLALTRTIMETSRRRHA